MYGLLAVMILALAGGIGSANSQPAPASDDYTSRIQPIFNSRCVACHSCYNAPCQFNLQSHSGLARGATKLNVYDRSRPKSVAPTRLDIDGRSVSDWRAKGFFDVVGGREPARTLLMQLVSLGPAIPPCSRKSQSTRAIPARPTAIKVRSSRGARPRSWACPTGCRHCRKQR